MKTLMTALTTLVTASLFATTGYWTGAVDGDWTNSANWKDGVIPGVRTDSGSLGDTAIFDGAYLSGEKVTTIDFATLVSIKCIKVQGGAETPVFTFGADKTQLIPLEYQGSFYVGSTSSGDETAVPVLRAILCLSLNATDTSYGGSNLPDKGVRAYVYNYNPSQVLHLNDFGRATKASSLAAINSEGLVLRGFDFQLDGAYVDSILFEIFAYCRKLIVGPFDPNGRLRDIIVDETERCTIEVPARETLHLPGSNMATSGYFSLFVYKPLEIVGDGDVVFSNGYEVNHNLWPGPAICSRDKGDVTIRTRLFSRATKTEYAPSRNEPGWLVFGDYATPGVAYTNRLVIAGDNCVSGTVFVSELGGAVVVDSIGQIGQQSRLGYGSCVRLSNGSALEYTGVGEIADRTLMLTNFGVSATGVLRHNGTGVLVYQGMVSQQVENATFALDGVAGTEGRFESVLASRPAGEFEAPVLSFEKRGAGRWTMTAANEYNGTTTLKGGVLALEGAGSFAQSSGLVFAGGALELADAGTAQTIALEVPVTVSAATSKIILGKNRSLTLSAIPGQTGNAKLDVVIDDFDSTLKVTGRGEGPAPEWLTVNGFAATFDAEGVLHGPETLWKSAESGTWATSDNWTAGTPDATKDAYIRVAGTPYEVSVGAGDTARRLFAEGSDVTLKAVGDFLMDGTDAIPSAVSDAEAVRTDVIAFRDGATFVADGESVTFTNMQGRIAVGSSDSAVTSVFRVVNGSLAYGGSQERSRFEVGVGGRLEISNSTVTASDKLNPNGGIIAAGGEIDISGTATFFQNPRSNTPEFAAFGTGKTTFRDDSRYIASIDNQVGFLCIRPDRAGETAELRFEDTSRIDGLAAYYVVGGTKGGRAIFTYDAANTNNYLKQYSSDQNIGYYLGVGQNYGYGEYNHLRGKTQIGNLGMMIGTCFGQPNAALTDCSATGSVHVAGGELGVSALGALTRGWDTTANVILGVTVGQGTFSKNKTGRPFAGSLTVSGGKFALTYGHLLVGTGAAEGDVKVTGGQVRIVDAPAGSKQTYDVNGVTVVRYATNSVAVVGLAGGIGRFSVEGGTVSCWSDFYVGGANTNVFVKGPDGEPSIFANYPFDAHDAKGTFTLSGGAFQVYNNSFILGADGTGELKVVGSAGSFDIGGNMVLSNNMTSVVSFRPDAAGVSALTVRGALKIVPGSQLIVDVTDVAARSRSYKLFDCGAIEGAFDGVTLVGGIDGSSAELDVRDGEIWCRYHSGRGSLLIVR